MPERPTFYTTPKSSKGLHFGGGLRSIYKLPILFCLMMMLLVNQAMAQTWEIGGTVAATGYMGDYNVNNPFKFTDPGFGGFVKRNFNGYLSVKLNYMHGTIRGADSTSSNPQMRIRNLSFYTPLSEFSAIAEFNLLKYLPEVGNNKFSPFMFIGVGFLKFSPKATYKGTVYDLRPLTTEGEAQPYANNVLTVPYGIGFKCNFSGSWNFIADLGYRNPATPYIDDTGGYYPDKTTLPNPVSRALSDRSGEVTGNYVGTQGTQRGNLRETDTYMFLGFTLSYTFVTSKCYFEK